MSQIETINAHFHIEYHSDGIIVYHAYDLGREAVDAMFAASTRHDQEYFRANKHLRRMFRVQTFTMMPTPYALHKLIQAEQLTPSELRESFAVIIPNPLAFRIMGLFLNRNLPPYTRSIARLFQDEDSALAWLGERLAELGE